MKTVFIISYAVLLCLASSTALADDLVFPETEKAIVQALRFKDGRIKYKGNEYISENGKIYEIIGGKRWQVRTPRGWDGIVEADFTPRVGARIHFDFDSAQIKAASYPLLEEYGKALTGELSDFVIYICGHADSRGSEQYNIGLSKRRARSVKEYLVGQHRIDPGRLFVKAYGETKPIASNGTEKGRALNRRVEFANVGAIE